MKIGDLVTMSDRSDMSNGCEVGIIIEVIDHSEVPPVVKILWPDGDIDKAWTDDLEKVSESR